MRNVCRALALVALVAAGCAEKEHRLRVGFSQIGAESAWRTAETKSIQEEAKKRNISLKFSDAQQKQENQIKALRSFIAQKVKAIILAPVVETGWEPVLAEVKAAGIPVVLVDRGIKVSDDSLYATLIASDFVEEGRMAGEWLAKKTGGKCNIVQLEGTPGSAPAIDRKRGFEEAIAKFPEMKILKSQTGDFDRAKGKELMEAFIKAEGKNIQAVYAHNDDMAIGAIQALKAAGMKPGTEVIVISIDGIHDAFQAMIDGELNATVECNPLLGPAAFDAVEKLLKGETLPKKTVVKDRLFEQATAAEDIKTRQY
ncbi:MAG TPA: ABC transporter substrate-binding protein [Planctomycetota bacterium]|nr:ABC transporter substrate-binding protein [Planctomycetota bacterium]HRR79371.1 ABC transporter substrate-binding protein [Planctomycetota bacterium]HRT93730.1 ABC transporter substrate-binding protein [Planctomycetota bacterium]